MIFFIIDFSVDFLEVKFSGESNTGNSNVFCDTVVGDLTEPVTMSGVNRAKKDGKYFGKKHGYADGRMDAIREKFSNGFGCEYQFLKDGHYPANTSPYIVKYGAYGKFYEDAYDEAYEKSYMDAYIENLSK